MWKYTNTQHNTRTVQIWIHNRIVKFSSWAAAYEGKANIWQKLKTNFHQED